MIVAIPNSPLRGLRGTQQVIGGFGARKCNDTVVRAQRLLTAGCTELNVCAFRTRTDIGRSDRTSGQRLRLVPAAHTADFSTGCGVISLGTLGYLGLATGTFAARLGDKLLPGLSNGLVGRAWGVR